MLTSNKTADDHTFKKSKFDRLKNSEIFLKLQLIFYWVKYLDKTWTEALSC